MTETPQDVDLSRDDGLIEQSDNSGEPGMPEENQDPNYLPEGTVQ